MVCKSLPLGWSCSASELAQGKNHPVLISILISWLVEAEGPAKCWAHPGVPWSRLVGFGSSCWCPFKSHSIKSLVLSRPGKSRWLLGNPLFPILRTGQETLLLAQGPFPGRTAQTWLPSCLILALTHHLSISSLAETRATFQPASRPGSQATTDRMQPLSCSLHFTFTWLLTSHRGVDT